MNGVYNTGYTEAERKERSMKHSPSSFLTGRFVSSALMAGALAAAIAVIPLKAAAQAPAAAGAAARRNPAGTARPGADSRKHAAAGTAAERAAGAAA